MMDYLQNESEILSGFMGSRIGELQILGNHPAAQPVVSKF
jgi:hypothetical protein